MDNAPTHLRDASVSALSAASPIDLLMSVMAWNPNMPPEPIIWCPRLDTVSKSTRSKASDITRTFCLQFCRYAGMRFADLDLTRNRIKSIRLLSSFDDEGATMEGSLIACSSTSCLIGFVKKAVHPAAK